MVSYVKQGVSARRGARCFSDIEAAPPEAVAALQERKLQAQLGYLRQHSPFYRDRLRHAGVDWDKLRGERDLEQVPLTVKQDLRDSLKAAPPFGPTWQRTRRRWCRCRPRPAPPAARPTSA